MILLDTSALIRWISVPEKLSKKARETIEEAIKSDGILISSISVWEICLLIKKERLDFWIDPENWLEKIESLPFIRFISVDNKIAAKSVNLDRNFHEDPADRMIVATALLNGLTIITSDKKILNYPHVQSIW